ncbi:LacI family DNA-binding transcriptional regulator [Cryobacterium suzukii]|uniref:LacI family DNA-binding transcriptional regulator n=1 Tax=Cryobacterium suzukii TaxID=1259198 RepID=A0A4V3ISU2_9MICO|nr:LacI family DNA-binding transcriptional regulator [Cryobacterium suzukii]
MCTVCGLHPKRAKLARRDCHNHNVTVTLAHKGDTGVRLQNVTVHIPLGVIVSDSLPTGRTPSIRDVARLAGVSHQTVSRVLNSHPSIRESTRLRVQQVIDELQYRPSSAARALVKGQSRTIGVLSALSAEYGPASSIAAIQDAAREAGYFVNTANLSRGEPSSIQAAVDHLMYQSVEGIVVIAPQVRVIEAIEKLAIAVPYVTLQSTSGEGKHVLSVDQIAGARVATRHLIDLGHRNIYHLAGPQDWIEAEARMRGFLEEMGANDVPTTAPILGDWTADFGYYAGRELLRVRDFTAIFSSNDQMALGLMHAIRDAGLDIPRDVSIVGFDDIPEAAHFWPPLTTVRQDFAELGRRCVALLLANITGSLNEASSSPLIPELVVRSSTAAPAW